MLRCRVFDFPLDQVVRSSFAHIGFKTSQETRSHMGLSRLFRLLWLTFSELGSELWEKVVIGRYEWFCVGKDGEAAEFGLPRPIENYLIAVGLPSCKGIRRAWRWFLPERRALLLAHGQLKGCRIIDFYDERERGKMMVVTDWRGNPLPALPAKLALRLLQKMLRRKGFGMVPEALENLLSAENHLIESNQRLRVKVALLEAELNALRNHIVMPHRTSTPTREELERALTAN
jgi:hypothetical protein